MPQPIGTLNGGWSLMLRLMLATYPALLAGLIAWGGWVTREVILASDFRSRSEARISILEQSRMSDSIQTARIEVLLYEIRDKLKTMETNK